MIRRCTTTPTSTTPSPPAPSTPAPSRTSSRAPSRRRSTRPRPMPRTAWVARAAATSTPAPRTPPGSGWSGRSRISRVGGTGSRSRRVRRPRPRWPSSRPRGEEILVGDDVYGGTYRYFERVHRPAGAGEARYADLASGPDALWEGLTAATRLVWLETPSNPLLKVTDIAAVAQVDRRVGGPGRRAASAPRHRQHLRLTGPPATPGAGRGRRVPLRHQVPRRPLGHDPGRRGDERRRRGRAPCGSCRTPWAPCPGRSTASSSCAACGRWRYGWSATPRTPWRWRGLAGRPDVAWVRYPGLADGRARAPGRGRGRAPDAARRKSASGGMVSFIPAPEGRPSGAAERASPSASRRASSPWQSRSAASSR